MKLTQLYNDDDAVSPVIGVILMVAITVILAAVIGTMVMDMTDSVGNAGPTASLAVSDHSDGFGEAGSANNTFLISHQNGDSFIMEDTRVIVSDGSTQVVSFESGSWTGISGTGGATYALQMNGQSLNGSDELRVGDSLSINATSDAGNSSLTTGEEYNVQIIHSASEKTLIDTAVTLN